MCEYEFELRRNNRVENGRVVVVEVSALYFVVVVEVSALYFVLFNLAAAEFIKNHHLLTLPLLPDLAFAASTASSFS